MNNIFQTLHGSLLTIHTRPLNHVELSIEEKSYRSRRKLHANNILESQQNNELTVDLKKVKAT